MAHRSEGGTADGMVEQTLDPFTSRWAWKGGAVAGVTATVVMGVAISVMNLQTLRLAIAGLYGLEGSLVAGWVAHLVHGTLFGLLFAAILADPGLYGLPRWRWKTLLAGVVYGLVLAVVGAGFIMPVWLGAVGYTPVMRLPNVTTPSVVWHAVYGAVLGLAFPVVEHW